MNLSKIFDTTIFQRHQVVCSYISFSEIVNFKARVGMKTMEMVFSIDEVEVIEENDYALFV